MNTPTIIGQQFCHWTVIGEAPRRKGRLALLCRCVCGQEKAVLKEHLTKGVSRSCGCRFRELYGQPKEKLYFSPEDFTGRQFARWTVLRMLPSRNRHRYCLCRCECGTEKEVELDHLTGGKSLSCGCLHREAMSHRKTHGLSKTREYRCWATMKSRCLDPKHRSYPWYGGRGIVIHPSWLSDVAQFVRDVGPCPSPEHTLDRIDPDGNYEPGNVRWAEKTKQLQHKRNTLYLTVNGERKRLREVAQAYGLDAGVLKNRVFVLGWPIEKALSEPVIPKPKGHSQ